MSYLIGFHWAWLLLSLVLGAIVGWFTYLRPRTLWMDGLVWLIAALVALAALVAISTVIPGRPGYWLEVALLMAVAYGVGCPIGWALRDQAFSDPASATDHDSRLPKPGYVFQGATLGGTLATPALGLNLPPAAGLDAPVPVALATAASEAATPAPILPPASSVAAASPEPDLPTPAIAIPPAPTPAPAPLEAVVPSETSPPPSADIVEPPPSISAPLPEPATAAAVPKGIRVVLDAPRSEPAATESAEAAPVPVVATTPPASPVPAPTPSSVEPAPAPTTPASAPAEPPRMPPVPDEDRHAGTRPDGLVTARDNKADDLKRIKGIGPQNEGRLHGLGVWHFDQIAAWTPDNVKWVGSYLAFHGRIDREKWIEQAKALALGQNTEVSKPVAVGRAAASKDDGSLGQTNVGGSVKPRKR